MQVVEDENKMSLSTFNLNHTHNLTIAEVNKTIPKLLIVAAASLSCETWGS